MKKKQNLDIILNPAKQLAEKYNKHINFCSLAIMLKLQNKGLKKISVMDSLIVMQEIDLDYLDSLESKIKSHGTITFGKLKEEMLNDKKVEQLDNDKKVEQLDNDKKVEQLDNDKKVEQLDNDKKVEQFWGGKYARLQPVWSCKIQKS
jgi:hypothetical protein